MRRNISDGMKTKIESSKGVGEALMESLLIGFGILARAVFGTLCWCCFFVFVAQTDVWWAGCLLYGVVIIGWIAYITFVKEFHVSPTSLSRFFAYVIPVYGDLLRGRFRHERKAANAFLRDAGLIRRPHGQCTNEVSYRCFLRRPTAWKHGYLDLVDVPVKGLTVAHVRDVMADSLAMLGAADYEVKRSDAQHAPHHIFVTLFSTERQVELKKTRMLDSLPEVKVDSGCLAVKVGRDVDGDRWLDLSDISGMTLAGLPGSGKTAAGNILVAGLLSRSDAVDLYVADGKGGADWAWAKAYLPDGHYSNADDYSEVLPMLHALRQEMRDRVAYIARCTGDSNFWHSFPAAGFRALVLVLDEVQTWTSPVSSSKEVKACRDEFCALVTELCKKGRSAGVTVVLLTQKPTSDSLPTAIRDVATLKVCFAVSTLEMAQASLGVIPKDGPSPTAIAFEDKGMSVLTTPSGGTAWCRWDYLPETKIPTVLDAMWTPSKAASAAGPARSA